MAIVINRNSVYIDRQKAVKEIISLFPDTQDKEKIESALLEILGGFTEEVFVKIEKAKPLEGSKKNGTGQGKPVCSIPLILEDYDREASAEKTLDRLGECFENNAFDIYSNRPLPEKERYNPFSPGSEMRAIAKRILMGDTMSREKEIVRKRIAAIKKKNNRWWRRLWRKVFGDNREVVIAR